MDDAGWDVAAAARRCHDDPRGPAGAGVRGHAGRAAARPHDRRDGRRRARARRRLHRRPGRRARRCAAWSTCCRPAATSTPSTRARSRRGWRGRPGRRWPSRSSRSTSTRPATIPQSVGLSVWGTSAMRTSGDDIAEVLALLGVRPVWDEASRRVNDLQVIPLEELGRPRIDVTVRISGFFRDAFPHVVAMLDDAVRLVAGAGGARRVQLRPGARARRPGRARRRAPLDHAHLRLQAGLVRRRDPAGRRVGQLAQRPGPRRGLHGVGRLRLRS